MHTTRRDFLEMTAGATLAATVGPAAVNGLFHLSRPQALRVLVLGGTGFIGPHLVRALQAQGHTVSIFNRGRSNTDLFPEVEKLIGDRNDDLEVLKGRTWDAVVDNSARINAKWVRLSADVLRDSVGVYLFTSTRSVYSRFPTVGLTEETAPTLEPDPAAIDEDRRLPYGQAKITMEYELGLVFPERHIIVRPGLIVGPGDNTDRFTYWPVRIDRGGEVLAVGKAPIFVNRSWLRNTSWPRFPSTTFGW